MWVGARTAFNRHEKEEDILEDLENYQEISAENDKEKRIFKEYLRIGSFFENLNDTQFAMLLPLIRNAAFMRITLDELSNLINQSGPVEEYKNGAEQFGMKQSAALQSYNALVKNYAAVIKTLFEKLPREKMLSAAEEWRRSKLSQKELEEALDYERREKAAASAQWMEKLKYAYSGLYEID